MIIPHPHACRIWHTNSFYNLPSTMKAPLHKVWYPTRVWLFTRSQGDAHALTPSDSVASKIYHGSSLPYVPLPCLPPFASFFLCHSPFLIISLSLVRIADWDQSEHCPPCQAHAYGEEPDNALPIPLYNLPKSFWTRPSMDAMRNVPDWFVSTPLDTLLDAATVRLQTFAYYSRWRMQVWQCHLMQVEVQWWLVFRP